MGSRCRYAPRRNEEVFKLNVNFSSRSNNIFLIAADIYLRAFCYGIAAGVKPERHGGFFSAPAQRSNFAHIIGDGEEGGATREELAFEICAQAVTHDRNAVVIWDTGELPDLNRCEELRLVEEYAINRFSGMGL